MSISLKTHKLLWGRSGNRCACPDCRNSLVADETETDDESVIGDEAHIVARSDDGPRGTSIMSSEDRDKYGNLILLCRIHHKIIDDQPKAYPVELLHSWKVAHEEWVRESLDIDSKKNKDDVAYASYLDEIFKLLDLENYNKWTSSLVSHGQPSIINLQLEAIQKIPSYVVSRFWPKRYEELENAIYNLKNVLNDLLKVFNKHAEHPVSIEADFYNVNTKKFYKIEDWDPTRYDRLLREFDFHVDLVQDLTLELTRAVNLVIEKVRKYVTPKFREEEGKVLITSGPDYELRFKTYKVEYTHVNLENPFPYNGLKSFMTERDNRDLHVGSGFNISYFPDMILGMEEE